MIKKIIIATVLLVLFSNAYGERIKDIVDIQGIRSNPLSGIGLVVGLADTGDSSLPSRQMLTNILRNSGLVLEPRDMAGGNIAVVMVNAELGPFDRTGQRIDVTVSAIGDAKSLQGGILLSTPLEGLDGQVYAVAQGGISIGGWLASGDQGSISKNHQTVGRIPSGAHVEREFLSSFVEVVQGRRYVTLNLRNKDFQTANNIGKAINNAGYGKAFVLDPGTITVQVPDQLATTEISGFIAAISKLEVAVDVPAVVVINERTGTIVVGQNVGISQVAIAQGSLVVKVKETAFVSQPHAPFSDAGTTEVIPETLIGVEESEGHLIPVNQAVTVSELAKALNAIGATPRDLIAIFNALKQAGALQAKLEIM